MSCPYSTLLGIRGQGVHERRVLGFALNDILATLVLAAVTTYVFKISFLYSVVGWFIVGEILHYVMGVDTAFLEMIHLTPKCSAPKCSAPKCSAPKCSAPKCSAPKCSAPKCSRPPV
jgi:hypothetical protein